MIFFDIPFEILFFLNAVLFITLIIEPYWKVGAWLLFLTSIEVNLYVVNFFLYQRFLIIHKYLNIVAVFFALMITYVAHKMKEYEYDFEPDELDDPWDIDNKIETKIYINTKSDNKIHSENCKELDNYDEDDKLIIGSKRYAEEKFEPCDKCNPFSD